MLGSGEMLQLEQAVGIGAYSSLPPLFPLPLQLSVLPRAGYAENATPNDDDELLSEMVSHLEQAAEIGACPSLPPLPPLQLPVLPRAGYAENATPNDENENTSNQHSQLEEREVYSVLRESQHISNPISKKRSRTHLSGETKVDSSFDSIQALLSILALTKSIAEANEALRDNHDKLDGSKICDLTCRSLDLVNCTLNEKISHLSLSSKSMDLSSTSNIRRYFPHASLTNHDLPIDGEERGKFGDLTMKAVIAIDLSQPNIALTKKTGGGGLFNWTDRTLSQLEKCLSNDETLKQKQIRLVISMFALLFYLMQDEDVNISKGCVLETFMGSTYNLLTSRSD